MRQPLLALMGAAVVPPFLTHAIFCKEASAIAGAGELVSPGGGTTFLCQADTQ